MKLAIAVFLALVALFAPRDARAAMMQHGDLTSLALEADEIVLAKRTAERDGGPYSKIQDHVVVKLYRGTLAVGAPVSLDYGSYWLEPMFDPSRRDAGASKASDEVVLFLKRADPRDRWNQPAGGFWLVLSGLRTIVDGHVMRFEQWNNPGGFTPVPQGRDPYDVLGDPRAQKHLTLPEFEDDLARAIARAADVNASLERATDPKVRAHLLDLLGSEDDDDGLYPFSTFGFYRDLAGERIVAKLAEQKDIELFLEALARLRGRAPLFHLRDAFPIDTLEAEAKSATRSLRLRLAAIAFLHARFDDYVHDATVTALLADPSPAIRAAGATLLGRNLRAGNTRSRAMVDTWKKEPDENVRLALFIAARDADVLVQLQGRDRRELVVGATRRGRVIAAAWGNFQNDPPQTKRLALTATRDGVTRTREFDPNERGGWSTVNTWGSTLAVDLDPPLAPGTYELALDVELETTNHKTVTRHIALGPMRVRPTAPLGPAPAFPGAATNGDAGVTAVTTTEDAALTIDATIPPSTPASAPPPPERPPSGCGCATPGESMQDTTMWVGLFSSAIVVGLVTARRRKRRS